MAVKRSSQAEEFLSELTSLPGDDQATVVSMLVLLSRVPDAAAADAWKMIKNLVAEHSESDEMLAGIRRIVSYLESEIDGRAGERPEGAT